MMTLAGLQPSKSQESMDLGPIQQVLGEDMPAITPTPLGRLRLINALKGKFGAGFKNMPAAQKALTHFDSEFKYFQSMRKIKGVKNG